LVHSALSSLGRVGGGADTVVADVLSVIGPGGTLVVPTFNYDPGTFDPRTTTSVVGAITEAVRRRPEAVRSLHPTHSVAAIGPGAEDVVRDHEKAHAFGQGSAFYRLLEMDAHVMLIGVGHTTSSIIHVAEELAAVPYIDRVRQVYIALPQRRRAARIIRSPGCSAGFGKIEERLSGRSDVREARVGNSLVRFMPARTVVRAACEMLREDQTALLCHRPDCQTCAEARAMVAAAESEARDREIAALLADPVGENIRPFEISFYEENRNVEDRN
jgi:aminoglycoside 3-N-acetyltransferase